VRADGVITRDVAKAALDGLEIDHIGLDQTDRNLLLTIIQKFDGGPVGWIRLPPARARTRRRLKMFTSHTCCNWALLRERLAVALPRALLMHTWVWPRHMVGNGVGPGLWTTATSTPAPGE